MSSAYEEAAANWQEAEHRANYFKALTGAQNRLMKAARDVESYGYIITVLVEEGTHALPGGSYMQMYELTKDKTVAELDSEGWTMILSPPTQ